MFRSTFLSGILALLLSPLSASGQGFFFHTLAADAGGGGGGGYFVLTSVTFTGAMGGLAGANSSCLTELQNTTWMGKGGAVLDGAHVKAFLCDGSVCNNLNPNTQYAFAAAGNVGMGGTTFTTDGTGAGPGDTASWSAGPYFGSAMNIWSGRSAGGGSYWANTTDANHCAGWSSSSAGNSGQSGSTSNTNTMRWANGTNACNIANRLICFVNP